MEGTPVITQELTAENYVHNEQLFPFIEAVFDNSEYDKSDLKAVAISEGPGSYTGLRVGSSAAKGLCYALDIPLISVNSLEGLANLLSIDEGIIAPMIDARRMEVYTQLFSLNTEPLNEIKAVVLDETFLSGYLAQNLVHFLGDGMPKLKTILHNKNAVFHDDIIMSSNGLSSVSWAKFQRNDFVDTAYYEPNYFKDFIPGKPKKIL